MVWQKKRPAPGRRQTWDGAVAPWKEAVWNPHIYTTYIYSRYYMYMCMYYVRHYIRYSVYVNVFYQKSILDF